jgi:hypothetical protein
MRSQAAPDAVRGRAIGVMNTLIPVTGLIKRVMLFIIVIVSRFAGVSRDVS